MKNALFARCSGLWRGVPLAVLLLLSLALFSCSGGTAKGGGNSTRGPGRPVRAEAVIQGDYDLFFQGLGTVTATNTVTVRSRVDGQLMKLHFTEGQTVKAGDLLAEIDPRPYQAQLEQAEGKLIQDMASLRNARQVLARYKVLLPQDSASPQQVDAQEAQVRLYEGAVKQDQGQIDAAKLQLVYCRITAPVGGRLGLRTVDEGNIVQASSTTGLVVITQVKPITVIFTVTEAQLPAVREAISRGKTLAVEAWDRTQSKLLATGVLLTIDNQIDTSTGTVRLKALFDNKDDSLFPNQFVNARIQVDTLQGVIKGPTAAVQRGQRGFHVYVVGGNGTVSLRQVTVGPADNTTTVLSSGVKDGEVVVTDGLDRLRDGVRVDVTGK